VLPRIGDVGLLEAVNGLVEDGVILRVLARVVDGLFMVGRSQEVTGARAASRNTRSAEGKLMRRPAIFPPRHLSCTGSWTCNPSHTSACGSRGHRSGGSLPTLVPSTLGRTTVRSSAARQKILNAKP
jgi:hypothetical protein